jgi:hypothetical protein
MCAMALPDVLPITLESLAVLFALVAGLLFFPIAVRWAVKAVRLIGLIGGLGVVTVTVLAAVLIFERN